MLASFQGLPFSHKKTDFRLPHWWSVWIFSNREDGRGLLLLMIFTGPWFDQQKSDLVVKALSYRARQNRVYVSAL